MSADAFIKSRNTPHVDITIKLDAIENGIKHAIGVLLPEWDINSLKFKVFTDGCTNQLVGCYVGESFANSDVALFRIFGENTDLVIDRTAELRTMILLHDFDLAGQVYGTFENGLCYKFIHGFCVDEGISNPVYYKLIAKELARLHTLPIPEKLNVTNPQTNVFQMLRNWISMLPDSFPDPAKHESFLKLCPSKEEFTKELESLEEHLIPLNSPVVFCHNDLLNKNVIVTHTKDRVYMIDFEYADFNYEAFDLGNHFNEWAGMHTVDYSLYPDKETQLIWLKHYMNYKLQFQGQEENNFTEKDLLNLYAQTNKFALLSHLLWAIWAVIQAANSVIDFDYLQYCNIRMTEYKKRKAEYFAIKFEQ